MRNLSGELAHQIRNNWWLARPYREARVELLLRRTRSEDVRQFAARARPGSIAIDVGANVGNHALAAARSVGLRGFVLALEPHPAVYRELVNGVRGSRVVPINIAASKAQGTVDLEIPIDSNGRDLAQLASLSPRIDTPYSTRVVRVQALRLDDLVPPSPPVSVIKIDVEGHERSVVEGAERLILEYRPDLILEIEQRHLGVSETVQDVVESICALGYSVAAITKTGLISYDDFDVHRDQLQWLQQPGNDLGRRAAESYINNFVFTPV